MGDKSAIEWTLRDPPGGEGEGGIVMRRTWVACLAGALAAAVILSGDAALAQEKKQCFLRAKRYALPVHLHSESGYRKLSKYNLFVKDRDLAAAARFMQRERMRIFKTEQTVNLVPASIAVSEYIAKSYKHSHLQFFRFPGSVEIYFAPNEDVYCTPLSAL